MESKIIELTKYNGDCGCLTCGADKATLKVRIQRMHREDNVTTFHICDQCLAKAQQDIQKICE